MSLVTQYILSSMILPAELLLAAAPYVIALPHRPGLPARLLAGSALCMLFPITFLGVALTALGLEPARGLVMSLLYAAASYWSLVALVLLCCRVGAWGALHCAACAYLTQHLAHCLRHVLLPQASSLTAPAVLTYALVYAAVYGAAYMLFARHAVSDGELGSSQAHSLATTLVTLAVALVLGAHAQSLEQSSPTLYQVTLLYDATCCLVVLWTQTIQRRALALRYELDVEHELRAQQRAHYELSAENVELINQKCHDLKYQVAALRHVSDSERRERSIDELERAVMIYDAVAETGNDILDTVLTEKSLLCERHSITMTCVADGACLDALDAVDIYSIVGNALDNAIETVSRLEDPSRRVISVTVSKRADLIMMQFENCCDDVPDLGNGKLPPTTKPQEPGHHGFGLRSIRRTAEKYGGFITLSANEGMFMLRATIPEYRQQPARRR